MKITINNVTYDTETATRLAHKPTCSSDQQLYQTPEGQFFVVSLHFYVDGLKLGPNEIWVDLGPRKPARSRLCLSARIMPVTPHEAIIWSIKNLMPLNFRGLLLESI